MNQITKSGSSFLNARSFVQKRYLPRRMTSVFVLCLSLMLVGSCNERASFWDFSKTKPNLNLMDQGRLLRYAYSLQAALLDQPSVINHLRFSDIKLALAKPDMARAEGKTHVWQYRTDSCVLDVFWQDTNLDADINHAEFRMRQEVTQFGLEDIKTADPARCMNEIIRNRGTRIEENLQELYAVLPSKSHKS